MKSNWILQIALLLSVYSVAEADCGNPWVESAFPKPLDYANATDRATFDYKVRRFHFMPDVERLVRGQTGPLPGDIAYSLRQSPNHHRALHSMMRWQLNNPLPIDAANRRIFSMECYFERALIINGKDAVVYLIKGIYFHRKGDTKSALEAYQQALTLDPKFAEAHYNIGLLYVELEQLEDAGKHAIVAYELGYPLPGLRKKLERLGH